MKSLLDRLPKSWQPHVVRLGFYLLPAYRSTGGRVEFVSPDLTSMRVRLPFNRQTRNKVGSLFGGSLFAITDGPHPVLLMIALGRDYIIWDKAASIQFKRPGRTALFADFSIPPEEVTEIRSILEQQPEIDRVYRIELKDMNGIVHAVVERTVYIAHKNHYKQKSRRGQ